ncbi:lysophospholipid acyltransferase family protein [Variovorax sp. J22R133]|uniref:lysophospholipid acyltransferase family protein n=1 Tax=Variovorax brevis TaxID=3053503 RepID=UPI002578B55B|nr:lysophospholipid acyltransferase family protein [Variovorax sp. J22R133]MDM0114572.1 lysophospholipid acyltransferase family protein [Variovorax sp. J22R133]
MLAKIVGWILLALVRLLTGAQARWWGCPPKAERRIYFANHQSHLDLVMIWAALPEELRSITRPIAARDYWANTPVKRWITTEVFNAIYVERGGSAPVPKDLDTPPPVHAAPKERIDPRFDAEAFAPEAAMTESVANGTAVSGSPAFAPAESSSGVFQAELPLSAPAESIEPIATPGTAEALLPLQPLIDALQSGDSIIIFPEGTRGHTGEPQKFKSGLFTLAQMFPEVVLVPAWIDNVQRVMPKGEVVPVPILCSVTFGAPIQLEEGEERRPFLDRAREAVIALRDV